jgi:hypothetical protein
MSTSYDDERNVETKCDYSDPFAIRASTSSIGTLTRFKASL